MKWNFEIRCDVYKHHWHDELHCWVYMETFYVVAKDNEVWSHVREFDTYEEATELLENCQKSVDFMPSLWYWYRIYAKPLVPRPWRKRKNWWIDYGR